MSRINELMRKHTKAELLRMAYGGGLVNPNSPEHWPKDEIASAVVDNELRAAARSGVGQPPSPPSSVAPPKRPPVRHQHDAYDTCCTRAPSAPATSPSSTGRPPNGTRARCGS